MLGMMKHMIDINKVVKNIGMDFNLKCKPHTHEDVACFCRLLVKNIEGCTMLLPDYTRTYYKMQRDAHLKKYDEKMIHCRNLSYAFKMNAIKDVVEHYKEYNIPQPWYDHTIAI